VTAQVTQPVLIVASRQDGGVPFGHAEALAASLPQAKLVESGASSHFTSVRRGQDRATSKVAGWLRAQQSSGPGQRRSAACGRMSPLGLL
jgi:pimeloyl-ACP methyl ester carboxylesterase